MERPETRARMERVIDDKVAHGLKELLEDRALTHDAMSDTDLARVRRQMEEARARRLQPHYIEWAFRRAFGYLGGRLARRERGRYEISHVPPAVQAATSGRIRPSRRAVSEPSTAAARAAPPP